MTDNLTLVFPLPESPPSFPLRLTKITVLHLLADLAVILRQSLLPVRCSIPRRTPLKTWSSYIGLVRYPLRNGLNLTTILKSLPLKIGHYDVTSL